MNPCLEWLPVQRALNLDADGIPGKKTLNAVSLKLGTQASWQAVQRNRNISADGIPGPATARAIAAKLGIPMPRQWPTQASVRANTSIFGKPGDNLTTIDLPYAMRLAWDLEIVVTRMTVNKACADAVASIFAKTLAHYGIDRIGALRLHLFGGCYNQRDIVGGSAKSMHAYGAAIDIDPDNNQLKWGRTRAALARSDYDAFWQIVESEGATSLGRLRNYDWMHFQFPTL